LRPRLVASPLHRFTASRNDWITVFSLPSLLPATRRREIFRQASLVFRSRYTLAGRGGSFLLQWILGIRYWIFVSSFVSRTGRLKLLCGVCPAGKSSPTAKTSYPPPSTDHRSAVAIVIGFFPSFFFLLHWLLDIGYSSVLAIQRGP